MATLDSSPRRVTLATKNPVTRLKQQPRLAPTNIVRRFKHYIDKDLLCLQEAAQAPIRQWRLPPPQEAAFITCSAKYNPVLLYHPYPDVFYWEPSRGYSSICLFREWEDE